MRAAVERTHGADVLRGVGSFGGVVSAKSIAAMDDPVLVASTDGVGTKVELAARLGHVRSVGHDIVNHCIGTSSCRVPVRSSSSTTWLRARWTLTLSLTL